MTARVDGDTRRWIAFCPECWGYSLIDRDGEIPHTADCSEPEFQRFVPVEGVVPAGQVEREHFTPCKRHRLSSSLTEMLACADCMVARAVSAEHRVAELRSDLEEVGRYLAMSDGEADARVVAFIEARLEAFTGEPDGNEDA